MALNPQVTAEAQWDYLIALLKSEAGLGPPPAGTTSGNRLTALKYVGQAYALWTKENPAIGVQLRESPEEVEASQRHKITTVFDMIIGVQSTDASASSRFGANTKANLEDAMLTLKPIINDNAGGGLRGVLMDPQYRNLGLTGIYANAATSKIKNVEYEWEVTEGENARVWAYALITFTAVQLNVAIF